MRLLEMFAVLAVITAIVGGVAVHALPFLLPLAALVLFVTRGGLGGQRA